MTPAQKSPHASVIPPQIKQELTILVSHGFPGFLAVSSGFGDQVGVVAAWRVDEGVIVSLAT